MKKIFLMLSLLVMTTSTVKAHSTIYTDDIGRMHFLGKDPGGKTLQQIQNYNNPAQKDLTDIIYKNNEQVNETKVNVIKNENKKDETKKQPSVKRFFWENW